MEQEVMKALDAVGSAYKELEKAVIEAIGSGRELTEDAFGYIYDDDDENTGLIEVPVSSLEARRGKIWIETKPYGWQALHPAMNGNYQATLYSIALCLI